MTPVGLSANQPWLVPICALNAAGVGSPRLMWGGRQVNHKRVEHLYTEARLQVRRRRRTISTQTTNPAHVRAHGPGRRDTEDGHRSGGSRGEADAPDDPRIGEWRPFDTFT